MSKKIFLFIIVCLVISNCSKKNIVIQSESKKETTQLNNKINPFIKQKITNFSCIFNLSIFGEKINKKIFLKGNFYYSKGNILINVYSPLMAGLMSIYQINNSIYIIDNFNNILYKFKQQDKIIIYDYNISFFVKVVNYLLSATDSEISKDIIEPEYKFNYNSDNFLNQIISNENQIIDISGYDLISENPNIFLPNTINIYDTMNEIKIELLIKNMKANAVVNDNLFILPLNKNIKVMEVE